MSKETKTESDIAVLRTADLTPQKFTDAGFAFEKVIKIAAQDGSSDHAVEVYAGRLLGPGADMEVNTVDENAEGSNTIPVWQFHPLDKDLKPNLHVIHSVISPHQVDRACRTAYERAKTEGKAVDMLIRWKGLTRIAGGKKQINMYDVAVRYSKAE